MTTPASSDGPAGDALNATRVGVSFTVRDLPHSVAWYCDTLGFTHKQDYASDGVLRAVALHAGAIDLLLTQDNGAKGWDREKGQGFSLQLTTRQDIDAMAARIIQRGGILATEPTDAFGARVFRIKDPDGFLLVFTSERPPR